MKEIIYREGLLRFRVPDHWVVEYEDDGGGMFYEDSPVSGTLRLNITSMTPRADHPVTREGFADSMRRFKRAGGIVETLATGNFLVTYQERDDEGVPLLIYNWLLGHAAPPAHAWIAWFTFTVMADREHSDDTRSQLSMLDREIRNAAYSAPTQ
ncbi:MAG: hypothetical protein ACLQVD_02700 [Capsulimonadaceae bacterium]